MDRGTVLGWQSVPPQFLGQSVFAHPWAQSSPFCAGSGHGAWTRGAGEAWAGSNVGRGALPWEPVPVLLEAEK